VGTSKKPPQMGEFLSGEWQLNCNRVKHNKAQFTRGIAVLPRIFSIKKRANHENKLSVWWISTRLIGRFCATTYPERDAIRCRYYRSEVKGEGIGGRNDRRATIESYWPVRVFDARRTGRWPRGERR
jgi:hypothetical protein